MARPRTVSDDDVAAATGRALDRHGLAGTTLAAVAREVGIMPAGLASSLGFLQLDLTDEAFRVLAAAVAAVLLPHRPDRHPERGSEAR